MTTEFKERIVKEMIEWGKSLVFALIIGALVLVFARPSFIIGPSMEPTFHGNSVVLVEKISYWTGSPKRGDVVVAKTALPLNRFMTKSVIKRVVGVAGDYIAVTDGKLFLNGNMMQENYIKEDYIRGEYQGTVPKGHVFIMGDNRNNSNDSRSTVIGFVPIDEIKGKVYLRVFPFSEFGRI
jgi:signal peptidase I